MKTRAAQREETRARILEAAVECFSEHGFRGASTREIARRAGTNQGLITYHFRSKAALWKAAVDEIFAPLRARESIRDYVRFAAAHPELFRLMVAEGTSDDARMQWLVDAHLKPLYDGLPGFGPGERGALKPHAFYALAGAGSLIFAVTPECRRLTGLDPAREAAIETHADFVARLLVP